MKAILNVHFSSGAEREVEFDPRVPSSGSLGAVRYRIEPSRPFSVSECRITLTPTEDVALTLASVIVPYENTAVGRTDVKYVYDNSINCNMFAGIRKVDSDDYLTESRDIFAVKSENGVFNMAFTSFERFFTEFVIRSDRVLANIYLENKPLNANEDYVLEAFAAEECPTEDFFERYTASLAERYVKRPRKPVPFGWSSWSCLYGSVTEELLLPEIERVAKLTAPFGKGLIQVDDGWQGNASFFGDWRYDLHKFPAGEKAPAEKCAENGLTYGLWLAPALICRESPRYFEQLPLINKENGKRVATFATIFPLDLSNPEVIRLYQDKMRRMKEEYGSDYFKIDFMANFLSRLSDSNSRVVYPNVFAVEAYRGFLSALREAVGDDVFLLSCGAAMGESIGIYDGMRMTSDITWNGVVNMTNITWWDIFRNNVQNIILRSYYDNALITDPDGLVVRDYETPYARDGAVLSYDEARLYATAVAMSGGHILLNEETAKLSEERVKLFTHILPPMGKAARPRDFFEFPHQTEAYVTLGENAAAVALYNVDDEPLTKVLDTRNYAAGRCAVIDMWTHDAVAVGEGELSFAVEPHSCRAYLVKTLVEGEVLFSASNFWCGYSHIPADLENEVVYAPADANGLIAYPNTAGLPLYRRCER